MILRRYDSYDKLDVYECELTEEQAKLFMEDEEKFFDLYLDELDFDFVRDKEGSIDSDYELMDDE